MPPRADAGLDQEVREGDNRTVTLDGSGSDDPDDEIASYRWVHVSGPDITLSDPSSLTPEFTVPNVDSEGASLKFELTVADSGGLQNTDTVLVNIIWQNEPPTAQVTCSPETVNEEETVELNGSGSDDPDDEIAAYQWSQTEGPPVPLSGSQESVASFTAPTVSSGTESLAFMLTVTDESGLQSQDTCTVTVMGVNDPPEAEDKSVTTQEDTGLEIILKASDINDDELSYSIVTFPSYGQLWTGEPPNLISPSQEEVIIESPNLVYRPDENFCREDHFTFKASDNEEDESDIAEIVITVVPVNDAPVISDDPSPPTEVDAFTMYSFKPYANDPDMDCDPNEALTFSITFSIDKPEWVEFNEATGELTGKPTNDHVGTTNVTITVTDNAGASASLPSFDLTVKEVSNEPPDTPVAEAPDDEAVFAVGESVILRAGSFSDNEDEHFRTFWQVRRSDGEMSVYKITSDETDDLAEYTFPEPDDFIPGLKYSWKVRYEDDREGISEWSDERSFKIGASDQAVAWGRIGAGTEPAHFPMVSFTFWPDDPKCTSVFQQVLDQVSDDGTYDKKFLRIGTYNPVEGSYTECGDALTIQPGKGYWFFTLKDVDEISFEGIPVSTKYDFEMRLEYDLETGDGWNMTACPNAANYFWDNLEVLQYNEDGTIKGPVTISSEENDLVDKRLWRWNNGTYVYYPEKLEIDSYDPDPDPDPSLMKPEEGYWVRAMAENVVLRFTTEAQRNSSDSEKEAGAMRRKERRNTLSSGEGPPAPFSGFTSEGSSSSGGGGAGCFISATSKHSSEKPFAGMTQAGLIFLVPLFSIAAIVWIGRKRQ